MDITPQVVADIKEQFNRVYSRMNFSEFCKAVGWNPDWKDAKGYYESVLTIARELGKFDEVTLAKVLAHAEKLYQEAIGGKTK